MLGQRQATPGGIGNPRKEYVEGLVRERESRLQRKLDTKDVDAELQRFSKEPEAEVIEAAVPGFLGKTRRRRSAKKAARTPAKKATGPLADDPALNAGDDDDQGDQDDNEDGQDAGDDDAGDQGADGED